MGAENPLQPAELLFKVVKENLIEPEMVERVVWIQAHPSPIIPIQTRRMRRGQEVWASANLPFVNTPCIWIELVVWRMSLSRQT